VSAIRHAVNDASYLIDGLTWLDTRLHREVVRLRANYQLTQDEFHGLYISDEQVDWLVHAGIAGEDDGCIAAADRDDGWPSAAARGSGPWRRLTDEFDLGPFELGVVLLALAPEIDLKYERILAYLNDDAGRRWPTVDIALRLFSRPGSTPALDRRRLAPDATLIREGILQPVTSRPDRPSWLASPLLLDQAITQFLSGVAPRPQRLQGTVEWRPVKPTWEESGVDGWPDEKLAQMRRVLTNPERVVIALSGRPGGNRFEAVRTVCGDIGLGVMRVEVGTSERAGETVRHLLGALRLQQRLEDVAIYVSAADAWIDDEGRTTTEGRTFARRLMDLPGPVFVAGSPAVPWAALLDGVRHVVVTVPSPSAEARRATWTAALAAHDMTVDEATTDEIADRFVLADGQIRAAAAAAADTARLLGVNDKAGFDQLAEAARRQTSGHIDRLMQRVPLGFSWGDLALPAPTLRAIREVSSAIRHGSLVYGTWGFGERAPIGRGAKVLFAGASGTGKTMAAGVIARDLGLDLHKVDLAGVVSKYIGETEKNLDRIFHAARTGTAILFFDEADALFGKRSEVKEAHDRYANVEVSYLLQKLEEHDGAVILASNLSRNIDDAFLRRLHYVVEFPLPDEPLRLRLWQGMFGPTAPLDPDVDFGFLARQFELPGGEIRNVAMAAAFLAADDGGPIGMRHLVRAMAQHELKRGRSPRASDFKQYHALAT
jgi:SpoVK/Ycf46/Vps4 family AAA+-type ATPase